LCAVYPDVNSIDQKQGCLYPNCLGKVIQAKITEFIDKSSHEEAVAVVLKYRGGDKLIQGIDYFIESDKYVLTRWYHLKRGSCCGNDCVIYN